MPVKLLLKKSLKTKNKYLRKFNYIFYLVVIGLLLFFIFFVTNQFFKIKTIEINKLSNNWLPLGIKGFKGENLLVLSTTDIEQKIVNNNPDIKSAEVKKIYPDKLKITIELYRPFVVLKVSNGFFILTEDGRIIEKKRKIESNLPIINFYQLLSYYYFNTGDRLEYKDLQGALKFLKASENLGLKIVSIDISGNNMIGFNLVNQKVVFSTKKNFGKQEYELRTIVKQFLIQGKKFKSLDLRFNKPVVKF